MSKSVLSGAVWRRTYLTCGVVLMAGLSSVAQPGPTLERIKQSGKIVIGYRETSVPFSYLDADKLPVGYAVDLCLKLTEAVRKKLEMKTLNVEYLMVTPSNRIAMVEQGKADLECGSTTNNAERRAKVDFTVPHYIVGARYLVRADDNATDLVGLEGRRVVSTKGTTPLIAIARVNKDRVLHLDILEAPDHARAFEMVE